MQLEYVVITPCKGYHIYRVLCEPRVQEGFFVPHDKHVMTVYLDEELLVFVGQLAREIAKISRPSEAVQPVRLWLYHFFPGFT